MILDQSMDAVVAPHELHHVKRCLWDKHCAEQAKDGARKQEHARKTLHACGKTMRYQVFKMGSRPASGYPLYIALHGGGGGPSQMNDSQWAHMCNYYRSSVRQGIYVAPRGISDTWDLHFQPESYALYQRLIHNMVLLEGADPNRVYLLGFSAGGDGVYQVAPRLPDMLAAANMSAGHHNSVSPTNLFNTPLLVQVGAADTAYNRNTATVQYVAQLAALAAASPGSYPHQLFVHASCGHNFCDNHPGEPPCHVISDPRAWLANPQAAGAAVACNTNAVAWLAQRQRDPRPYRIVWDLDTRAELADRCRDDALPLASVHGRRLYWLDVGPHSSEVLGSKLVVARVERDRNAVVVEQAGRYLRVWLDDQLLDLGRPLVLEVGGQRWELAVQPRLRNLAVSLAARCDPCYMYAAHVTLTQGAGGWQVQVG